MIPGLIKAYDQSEKEVVLSAPIEILRNWDFAVSKESVAMTLAHYYGTNYLKSGGRPEGLKFIELVRYWSTASPAGERLLLFKNAIADLIKDFGSWNQPWGHVNRYQRINGAIRQNFSDFKSLNVLIIGDIIHSRVALSNIFCLQKLGAKVGVCGPSTLMPKFLKSLNVEYFKDLKSALSWCDVANVLRIQLERQDVNYFPSLREYSMTFGIDKRVLSRLNKKIMIMHPGPINRGVELSSDIADSDHSIILDQVENGVAIRMAVLFLLASKTKES